MAETPSIRGLKRAASTLRQAAGMVEDVNRVLQSAMLGQLGKRYVRHAEIVDQVIAVAATAKTERAFSQLHDELGRIGEDYMTSPLEDVNAELKSRALSQIIGLTARVADALDVDFDEEIGAILVP